MSCPLDHALATGMYGNPVALGGRREDDTLYVAKVTRLSDGKDVVIKGPRNDSQLCKHVLLNEMQMLRTLPEPIPQGIPTLLKAEGGYFPYIEVEYIEGRPLHIFLKDKPSYEERVPILLQLIDTLGYLHINNILYGDMRPDNVLVADGNAYLTDFGSAVNPEDPNRHWRLHTNDYTAPELCVAPPIVTQAADVYAFAKVVLKTMAPNYIGPEIGASIVKEIMMQIGCGDEETRSTLVCALSEDPFERPPVFDLEYAVRSFI